MQYFQSHNKTQSAARRRSCPTVHSMLVVYRECLVLLQCLTGWGVLLPDFFTSSLFAPVLGVLGCWVHKTNFISKTRITVKITLTQNKQKHLAECLAFWLRPRYGLYPGERGGWNSAFQIYIFINFFTTHHKLKRQTIFPVSPLQNWYQQLKMVYCAKENNRWPG